MKLWQKGLMCLWAACPFITIANFREIEVLAIQEAYRDKQCGIEKLEYREKDYAARYEEGYEKGFDTGVHAAYHNAKAATFDILMEKLDEMGVFNEGGEQELKGHDVKTALHHIRSTF